MKGRYCNVPFTQQEIDHFCKDDTVVSRNTFLPLGQAERNETTWSKVDVGNEVRVIDQFL